MAEAESGSENSVSAAKVIEDVLRKGGVRALKDHIARQEAEINDTPFKIAVTGACNSGKSSFINAIRNLKPGDEGFAEEGPMQTTLEVTAYPHPDHPNFVLYDLPGVGTSQYPRTTYLNDVKFGTYDFYILVFMHVIKEDDLWLSEEMEKNGKELYFVRTYIDITLQNEKRNRKFDENSTLQFVRTEIDKYIQTSRLYLVCNHDTSKWDFPTLLDDLVRDTPDLKKTAMTMIISAKTQNIIQKKANILKDRIKFLAFLSATVNAIPIPVAGLAVDMPLLILTVRDYRYQLGLCKLQSGEFTTFFSETNTKELIVSTMKSGALLAATEATEEGVLTSVKIAIPIIGSLISAGISYTTTYWTLSKFLNEIKQEALQKLQ